MEFTLDGNGAHSTGTISLNADHENFKLSILIIPSADFDGKVGVSYSPDNINWFPHADMWDVSGPNKFSGNLFFPVPFVQVGVTTGTKGTVKAHLFGSLAL